jgi:aspartate-semialdehyde dehydrogenase
MNRRSGKEQNRARIAVIGAVSTDGSRLRQQLAVFGVPGSRVDLFGGTCGETVISEYDGEARLVQEPEPEEITGYDLIFLCESGESARRCMTAAPPDALVIDLVGSSPGDARPPLIHLDVNPDAAREHGGVLQVPHPVALLLAELLDPLERKLGLSEVIAVVLRPASDFGADGVEELRQQTVRLLNFTEVPVKTFGRQLAFNLIPQARLLSDGPQLEARITEDVGEILGWSRNHLTLRMLMAPVFYGHALQMRLRFNSETTVDGIVGVLREAGFSVAAENDERATPMDVSGERTTNLYEVVEDGMGGYWIMAVAGELGDRSAEHAVRVADSLLGL